MNKLMCKEKENIESINDFEFSFLLEIENEIRNIPKRELEPQLKKYDEAVSFLAENNSDKAFFNDSKDHAAIVMSNIFKKSNNEIMIYANNFNGAVSLQKEYLESLVSYIKRRGKIYLVYKSEPNEDSIAYKLIKKYKEIFNDKVEIKQADEKFNDLVLKVLKNNYHFTIGDGKMFRIEVKPEPQFGAFVCFNNKEIGHKLSDIFAKYFSSN